MVKEFLAVVDASRAAGRSSANINCITVEGGDIGKLGALGNRNTQVVALVVEDLAVVEGWGGAGSR